MIKNFIRNQGQFQIRWKCSRNCPPIVFCPQIWKTRKNSSLQKWRAITVYFWDEVFSLGMLSVCPQLTTVYLEVGNRLLLAILCRLNIERFKLGSSVLPLNFQKLRGKADEASFFKRSVSFRKKFCCHQIYQKINKMSLKIFALASKTGQIRK